MMTALLMLIGCAAAIVTAESKPRDQMLTPLQAAQFLRISRRSLHTLTRMGKVPSVQLGRRLRRYSQQSLEQLIERQLEKSTA